MKKIAAMLCLCLLSMSSMAMAAPLDAEPVSVGEVEYDAKLDLEDVILLGFAAEEFEVDYTYVFQEDTVLYIIERTDEDVFFRFDEQSEVLSVEREKVKYVSDHYNPPTPTIKPNGLNTNRNGSFTITFYCAACNTPPGSNTVALSRSHAYVGSCASNDFPLGSVIYVEGHGTYFVNDRVGRSGVIDIYTGDHTSCSCAGKRRANAWRV